MANIDCIDVEESKVLIKEAGSIEQEVPGRSSYYGKSSSQRVFWLGNALILLVSGSALVLSYNIHLQRHAVFQCSSANNIWSK